MSAPDITASPLSVWMVGTGEEPVIYTVQDRRNSNGVWSFVNMSIVERAALRALLEEGIAMIDKSSDMP